MKGSISISISYISAVLIATLLTAIIATEEAAPFPIWLILAVWFCLTLLIWIGLQYPWLKICNLILGRN